MLISSPIFTKLMNVIGRKYTIMFVAVPQLFAWLSVGIGDSIYMYYVSRLFNGIGDGIIYTALLAYIGEIATPKVRGLWGNTVILSIYVGEFIINFVGTFLSVRDTGYLMCAFPLIFAIAFSFMPESPYYFLQCGRRDKAEESLRKLRMKDDVDIELKQLEADVRRQISESNNFMDLFKIVSNRKALFICCFVRFAQQFSGISAYLVYNQYLFQKAGGSISYSTSSNIFIGMLCIFVGIASYTLDKFGRRMTMMASCGGCFLILLSLVIYFYLSEYTTINVEDANWYPLFGMMSYTVIYSFGLGVMPTIVLSEMFSASVKGRCLTITNMFYALYLAVSTKIFQILMSNYGLIGPVALYTISCFVSMIVSYFCIPETKGKTLEEIQQMLKH